MRESVICFRTSEKLRKTLERISQDDRRSLSSVIENILYDHIERRMPKPVEEEKRRFTRIKVCAPALVTGPDGVVHAGMINDMSPGGINVSVPIAFFRDGLSDSKISVVFTLGMGKSPISMECLPRHIRSDGPGNIGASLIDADFRSCRAVQDYLMEKAPTATVEDEKDACPRRARRTANCTGEPAQSARRVAS